MAVLAAQDLKTSKLQGTRGLYIFHLSQRNPVDYLVRLTKAHVEQDILQTRALEAFAGWEEQYQAQI